MWGVDIVGKLSEARGKHTYVIVAADYFTKWVEAKAAITCAQVVKFLWQNILTRYGVPQVLVTDNDTQFSGAQTREFCKKWGIEQRFSPVCYPQSNGQVEVMNKTIFTGIKKNLIEGPRQWPEELERVLWSYRTTPSSATGETPFSLVYGVEAVIPLEIGLPSRRILCFEESQNREAMEAAADFRDELRDRAFATMTRHKQTMARYYNKQVRGRQFRVGDFVLRMLKSSRPATHKKLGPKWEGPYRVRVILGPGSYLLEELDGTPIEHAWHAMNLRKYYV